MKGRTREGEWLTSPRVCVVEVAAPPSCFSSVTRISPSMTKTNRHAPATGAPLSLPGFISACVVLVRFWFFGFFVFFGSGCDVMEASGARTMDVSVAFAVACCCRCSLTSSAVRYVSVHVYVCA